jgi:predicted nucleic acid-binding protein
MILVDTSIWVDHLNETNPHLEELLNLGLVRTHPFVVGEIALGKLRKRSRLLSGLNGLEAATLVSDADVVVAIGALALDGAGIGYVDAHLLLSTRLDDLKLWTRDKRLAAQAERLGVQYRAIQ